MLTTVTSSLRRPINREILKQHAEEAAFCWLRRQEALWRPGYRHSHLQRLDRLLDAHLEGLRRGATAALPLVLENLQRWKTPDEVFASTYTLLHSGTADWSPLERVLEAQPTAANGAAAALIWSPGASPEAHLKRWNSSAIPALRLASASVRATHYANDRPNARNTWLAKTLVDSVPEVRARALRCVGEWRLQGGATHLQHALLQPDPHCRFESACAMAWLGMPQADDALLAALPLAHGTRLRRGVLLFALTAQPAAFETWVSRAQADPMQTRALIWSLAFRGNGFALSKLLDYLRVPQHARLAGYAIGHITGMDLDEQGLWRPEHQRIEDTPYASEDDGLLAPDSERLIDWTTRFIARLPKGACLLAGQDQVIEKLRPLVKAGWQPQRWHASVLLDMKGCRPSAFSEVRAAQL